MIYPATKTLALIESVIRADQGASYRRNLGMVMPHIGDAYDDGTFPFRKHLGASMIGRECAREIWYGWRWATEKKHEGRMVRLFNRGHMEEGRFIAMLLAIGVQVYQQDSEGNQYRISDAGGHFGGSGDGILVGVPDLEDPTMQVLGEFKTANEKSFNKVKKSGVQVEKFEHYVQMNIYMQKMGIAAALYMLVNKNTDELYAEIIPYDSNVADQFLARGISLVYMEIPPEKINESPGFWKCRFCDHKPVCHLKSAPVKNCRTCKHSIPLNNGTWVCELIEDSLEKDTFKTLSKEEQYEGCSKHERAF